MNIYRHFWHSLPKVDVKSIPVSRKHINLNDEVLNVKTKILYFDGF